MSRIIDVVAIPLNVAKLTRLRGCRQHDIYHCRQCRRAGQILPFRFCLVSALILCLNHPEIWTFIVLVVCGAAALIGEFVLWLKEN
jgi:hypothetical protein